MFDLEDAWDDGERSAAASFEVRRLNVAIAEPPATVLTAVQKLLQWPKVGRKRSENERRKSTRTTPSPESIQDRLDAMADSVRQMQTDVEALMKRPNVLPWRKRGATDTDAG
jgi:hypothetical protein